MEAVCGWMAGTATVVEVRHPVEVGGSERDHLQQWLSKRVGYQVSPPQLDKAGLKLVGGRLLPGPDGPARLGERTCNSR